MQVVPARFPGCARPRDQGLAWLSTDCALKKKSVIVKRYNGAPGMKPGAPRIET
jgi:hypothetical protein